MTTQQICERFGCTSEQLKRQYKANLNALQQMRDKAQRTGKKVNGYTLKQLTEHCERYKLLSQ